MFFCTHYICLNFQAVMVIHTCMKHEPYILRKYVLFVFYNIGSFFRKKHVHFHQTATIIKQNRKRNKLQERNRKYQRSLKYIPLRLRWCTATASDNGGGITDPRVRRGKLSAVTAFPSRLCSYPSLSLLILSSTISKKRPFGLALTGRWVRMIQKSPSTGPVHAKKRRGNPMNTTDQIWFLVVTNYL